MFNVCSHYHLGKFKVYVYFTEMNFYMIIMHMCEVVSYGKLLKTMYMYSPYYPVVSDVLCAAIMLPMYEDGGVLLIHVGS